NPPIYDFSAYDFWLKPYGLLRAAGMLPDDADVQLFDYLDRWQPAASKSSRDDEWGRGSFDSNVVDTPASLQGMRRRYRRYGIDREHFCRFLRERGPFDVALIQTVMTYWYPGVREVLEDLGELAPRTRIVWGGVYATLCAAHARRLGADLVIEGSRLGPLWEFLTIQPAEGLPRWDLYTRLEVGILKLAVGCPFRCTYCSVPRVD